MSITDLDMRPGARTGSGTRSSVASTLPAVVMIYLIVTILPVAVRAGPLVLSGQRILLLIVTIPLLIRIYSGKCGGVIAADILFPLHIAWAAVALYFNNPDQMIQQTGSVGIEFIGGYAVGRAFIRTPAQFRALARTLMTILLISLPFIFFETISGRPLLLEVIRKIPGIFSLAGITHDSRLGLDRVQLAFPHPIHFGLFCATIMPLVFCGLKGKIGDGKRFFVTGLVAFCGFLSLSSGALLAIAMQCGLIFWSVAFHRMEKRWTLLLALLAFCYVVIDLLSNRTPYHVFLSYATFSSHTAYFRSIILDWGIANVIGSAEKGIVGSPWVGLGLNDWVRPPYMYSGTVDNFWLVMAMRYGLPGFFLLVVGYVLGIFRVMRRRFKGSPDLMNLQRGWVFVFVGMTFTLSTVHIWSTVYSYVFFLFGAGMWLIWAKPEEVPEDEDGAQEAADAQSRYTRFTRLSPARALAQGSGGPSTRFSRQRDG